ncbi:hypothetical protein HY839_00830 [Candidatus Azambacteria bacterium]|nr:hypothetical protein [Candidatus Azambacteria bacterium]
MKDSHTKKILHFVALAGGVAALSVANPLLPRQLLREYMRAKKFEKNKFMQDLKRLQKRELIDIHEAADGTIRLRLKAGGKEAVLKYNLETMTLARPKRWDGTWRLVMFDIPSHKNTARDALRRKLKELDFYQLQKSVFLSPFPCEKEIDALGVFWGVRDHIILMYVSRFEGEEKLKRVFGIE